ncbi:hypothetical protein HZS_7915 [Henneguya salminicola]|nr:hypothetical protein HZS_7915 [Henneguya salminicola]
MHPLQIYDSLLIYLSDTSINTRVSTPQRCPDNRQPFLRRYWCQDANGKHHQILVWVYNESPAFVRYMGYTFIGTASQSATTPFPQCELGLLLEYTWILNPRPSFNIFRVKVVEISSLITSGTISVLPGLNVLA